MTAIVLPEHDCPPCLACRSHVATPVVFRGRADAHEKVAGRPAIPRWLWCPACGHDWSATPEDFAQALAAREAWEAKQRGSDDDRSPAGAEDT